MGSSRISIALVAAMCALTACTAKVGAPTGASPTRKPTKATASISPDRPGNPGTPGFDTLATRVVPATGPVVTLTGKVKLLSDQGAGIIAGNTAGIISNNTGGLVSDQGAGIVSNNAGGLISDHGSGMVGKTKYALAQNAAPAGPAEFLLADAEVSVFDAAGNRLVDGQGKPVTARSDGQGGYQLASRLPAGNLVLKVKLWNGGTLTAILAQGAGEAREVPIDTAATLGATYVLEKYVKGDQGTFDKLPASEAERLRRELEQARALLTELPTYEPGALLAATDALRAKAPAVDKSLADIEVLLLGGLGDGKPADRVALNQPHALAVGADGTLYIGESSFGRIRAVSPAGLLATLMDGAGGKIAYNVPDLKDMAVAADGTFYALSQDGRRVHRIPTSGAPTEFAGGGQQTAVADGRKATELALDPISVAVGPDGKVYVGETKTARILAIAADGATTVVAGPAWGPGAVEALELAPDGTLYALHDAGKAGSLWKRAVDGAWTQLAEGLDVGTGDVALGPDGSLYYVEENAKRVWRRTPDGQAAVIAGGDVAGAPALVTPAALAVGADGTLYLADRRTNLVHARKPDGTWRLAAGASGAAQASDGFLSFNGPAGVAFDAAGRMFVAEGTGHGVQRFDGKTLERVAGGVKGDEGDGGPAVDARFDSPGAIAFKGDDLLVMDSRNYRIRAIGKDGVVRPFVGLKGAADERIPLQPGVPRDATVHAIKGGSCIVVGPDGLVYFAASGGHQIARLRADGQVELVAGRPYGPDEKVDESGDGGDAVKAGLTAPLGMVFDAKGDLIVADTGNMRLRKITGLAPGGTPRIDHYAGMGRMETIAKLFSLEPGWERAAEGTDAASALMVGPAAMVYDQAGNLYLSEAGTTNVAALTFEGDSIGTASGLDLKLLPPVPPRIRKITPDGKIHTVGGPGAPLFDPAKGEGLGLATGLAIDPQGRLVVVDVRENAIHLVPKGGY